MIAVILRNRLVFRPVLLSSVIKPFVNHKHLFRFFAIVDEFLPEEKTQLLKSKTPGLDFVKAFDKKHFPIEATPYYGETDISLDRLTDHIPVRYRGLTQYSYDCGNLSHVHLLAAALCECPSAGGGARLSVVERFKEKLGGQAAAVMQHIPPGGFPLADVEEALKDADYPGLLERCRYLFGRTGNAWLDTPSNTSSPHWTRENVDALTRGWPSLKPIEEAMESFSKWLKADFPGRALEIARYVAEHRPVRLIEILGDNSGRQELVNNL